MDPTSLSMFEQQDRILLVILATVFACHLSNKKNDDVDKTQSVIDACADMATNDDGKE
jgi:GTP-sensing pleiotropic transcriptional regulator CodY